MSQARFFGLAQTLKNKTDVIFNEGNLGKIQKGKELCLLDISSMHKLKVGEERKDSIDYFNFIGGDEYQANGKSLSYFNTRVVARYNKTIPYGDYLLARELGVFFSKNNFFICLDFAESIDRAEYLNINELRNKNYIYNFQDGIVNDNGNEFPLKSFFKVRLIARNNKSYSFVVVEHSIEGFNYFIVYLDGAEVAKIFNGILKE